MKISLQVIYTCDGSFHRRINSTSRCERIDTFDSKL